MHRTSFPCLIQGRMSSLELLLCTPSQMSIGSFIDTSATGPNHRIQASKLQFRWSGHSIMKGIF